MRARAHLCSLEHPNKSTLYPLCMRLCTGELNAIQMLSVQSFLRKGVALSLGGSIRKIKDLKQGFYL